MNDYYLSADSREELHAALAEAGLLEDGALVSGAALDELGSQGEGYPFLANLRVSGVDLDPLVLPLIDEPATPTNVWFDIPDPPEITDAMRDQSRA